MRVSLFWIAARIYKGSTTLPGRMNAVQQLDHDPLKNEKLSRKLEERDLIPWNRLFTYYY